MADEKNVNDQFTEEAQQRNDNEQEKLVSARASDMVADQNETIQETEDYLPQDGLFDKMTSDIVKPERMSYEDALKQSYEDLKNRPDEPKQEGPTQGGQKM